MNPEEGELRPQLLTCLGLRTRAERDVEVRAEVVRRRIALTATLKDSSGKAGAEQGSASVSSRR